MKAAVGLGILIGIRMVSELKCEFAHQRLQTAVLGVARVVVVLHGIGILVEQTLAKELLILVLDVDLCQLPVDILLEDRALLGRIHVVVLLVALEHVESDIVAGVQTVVVVDLCVDILCDIIEELVLRRACVLLAQPVVDAGSAVVLDMSLEAFDAHAHAFDVVARCLFPERDVALELELACFEIVAWVVLIGDRQWHDMQSGQAVDDAAFAAHDHHLQDGRLRIVGRVLGTALTLCNPHVFVLLADDEMHIFRHALAGFVHLHGMQRTLHGKRLVDAHEILDPWNSEQIVADGDLARRGEAHVEQQFVEQSRVEDDVAVVAHEGVAMVDVYARSVHTATETGLVDEILQYRIAERLLKLQIGLAAFHLLAQVFQRHAGEEAGDDLLKLWVGQQPVVYCGELLWGEGANGIKF